METDRIILRRWTQDDAESMFRYASDPEVGPRAGWPPHKSIDESRAVIRDVFSSDNMWAVALKETGEAIGAIGYLPYGESNIPMPEGDVEIGYWIGRPWWNKGICTEALELMLDYCRDSLGVETAWSDHFTDNPASGRVMTKCGFVDTGLTHVCENLFGGSHAPVRIYKKVLKREGYSLEALSAIVREASKLMLTDHFEIMSKGSHENIVTSADLAVQEFLCAKLSELIPGSGFLCEEEGMQQAGDYQYLWIIDPIDGTMNYSRSIRDCAISVGLKKDGELFAGVVYSAAAGEMFTAEKGKGAFLNGKRIHASDRSFEDSLICTAFSTYNKDWAPVCIDILNEIYYQTNDFRRFGVASLELCYLAMGRCELYFEYRLQPWDYAAGSIILQEAGGVLRSLHGTPLTYAHQELVIGANSEENFCRLSAIIDKHIDKVAY